jgi:glycosyltransferase involved in cell wall biosynthesis
MSGPHTVDVVIPTTCTADRWESLQRAIASAITQDGVNAEVMLVVNGDRYDPECLAALRARADLRVHYRTEGSLPLALRTGRQLVKAPFFCFLDDDDEYLPGALVTRLRPLIEDDDLDLTVTPGLRCVDGVDRPVLVELTPEAVNRDALAALSVENWLASCGGLYRTASIGLDHFDGVTKYYEWTYLAHRLALDKKLLYVAEPTFRINDTSDSLSKSVGYRLSELEFLHKLLDLPLPRRARTAIRRKIGGAHHRMSDYCRQQGWPARAWQHHFSSLLYPGGWKYVTYSRHLMMIRRWA